jgi:DNA-binding XRE family transcriptional regulator
MEQRKLSPAAARVNAGIKQKNAADSLGVTTATLQNWEKGKTSPPIGKAQKMAMLYKVRLDEISFT